MRRTSRGVAGCAPRSRVEPRARPGARRGVVWSRAAKNIANETPKCCTVSVTEWIMVTDPGTRQGQATPTAYWYCSVLLYTIYYYKNGLYAIIINTTNGTSNYQRVLYNYLNLYSSTVACTHVDVRVLLYSSYVYARGSHNTRELLTEVLRST